MEKNRKNTKTEFFLSYLFKCNIEISLEQFFIDIFSMWKSCMFVCIYSYIFLTVKLPCSEPNTNIKQKKKTGAAIEQPVTMIYPYFIRYEKLSFEHL